MRTLLSALFLFCSFFSSPASAVSDENYDRGSSGSRGTYQKTYQKKSTQGAAAYASTSSALVNEARRYIGSGPVFGRKTLWCGNFMDYVLRKSGYRSGGNLAKGYLGYGRRISGPQVGALAIFTRGKGGGHVGVISGFDSDGNILVVSGNHNNIVAEAAYPRSRAIGYVMPM